MAKSQSKNSGTIGRAAEAVGHALGSVAGTIDSLQAQHPHPVDEAREALAAGQATVVAAASKARTRATGMVKKAKAKSKPAVARAKRTARRVVKRAKKGAKKAVSRGRKAVRRVAGRLKR